MLGLERDLRAFAAGGSGYITAAQSILARRVAIDLTRLELLDEAMATGAISDASAKIAHSLRNSTRLGLRDLRRPELCPPSQPKAQKAQPAPEEDEIERLLREVRA